MCSTDNKDKQQFINLPFILLNKIINNLDESIDRISFSLVCKRWFDNRNKYLCFNNETFMSSSSFDIYKNFTLNSYKELFQLSINQSINKKHLVLIVEKDEIQEYIVFLKLFKIRPNSVEIVQTSGIEMLPSNIKHISVVGKFSFKAQISSVYTNTFSTLQHLETLDLSRVSLSNNDKIGPLPTSLISISIPVNRNFQFDDIINSCNHLPNLKFIDYGSFNNDGNQRLNNTSIKSIKLNRSTKLTDQSIPASVEIIDFNDFRLKVEQNVWPPSIQSISIDTAFIDANDNLMNIPSSIKNITITNEQFTFNIRRLDQQFILLYANNILNIDSAILNINCLTNYLKNAIK
ncbi:hypothetical protein PPL_06921 [Heterostelium album PN500]|uniref:F-box domain-containing protein n=1 Tax=Heterostelium pallidum (strain ATCC 26659 / Pp 5 / PN500) TaxID=670386 RepID=D3BDW8_HETP5|nr:hypothetical protein PPL_06921 [Heterostelium album PN500]EFA80099.1 hypothetical protein PPL_06921 [Heterostelium album PN500]|eukprot:XP_020432219.1 hypothetical protein PPL_06921 [Heterostelium album PN500]